MKGSYLLDTCAWLDLNLAPEGMCRNTLATLESEPFLHLASVSFMEVARKASTGQLALSLSLAEWMARAADSRFVRPLDISIAIAIEAFQLPGSFHKDPADRVIVATARHLGLTVVTSDRKILEYPHVRTLNSR